MCVFSHVYSTRQEQTTHWGKYYDNRKAFSLCLYVVSFQMISSNPDFIHTFNDFIHVYSPGARVENPLGTNVRCKQKALTTSTICCKFQTNLFEFWFYTHLLLFFHIYIAPCRGRQSSVDKILMSTEKPCRFAHLLQVSKKYLWSLILYIIFLVFFFFCFFVLYIYIYMYIAPGQGQTTPWGQIFYININLLSLWSFAVSFFH